MIPGSAAVFVIDDDALLRAAIQGMLKSVGLRSETFGTTQEFLQSKRPDVPSCLVLDVRLPGVNGLDFQRQLADAGVHIPIIFITGHGDIPMSVRAMKKGALEFLTKPFRGQELLDAVREGVDRDRGLRSDRAELMEIRARFDLLTPRETEILSEMAQGKSNGAIAKTLGVSERAVEKHSNSIFAKFGLSEEHDLNRRVKAVLVYLGEAPGS